MVEAQHRVSTLKLVDTLEEQALLEDLIEETKPAIPAECRHLDYLLATPFRYGSIYPTVRVFVAPAGRRASSTPRKLSPRQSPKWHSTGCCSLPTRPQTPWPRNAAEYTAFSAAIRTGRAIDLTRPPLSRDSALWTRLRDYEACQDLLKPRGKPNWKRSGISRCAIPRSGPMWRC